VKVLVVHNAYQERGGEDAVVEAQTALLRRHGHEVSEYRRHNDEVNTLPKLQVAAGALWSQRSVREVSALLAAHRPDLMHVHNTFPLISPSVYSAAQQAGVPVVQTAHNFRIACPQAMFLREGRVCEDCLGRAPWPAVRHACYRGSHTQSLVAAGVVQLHRSLGTWRHQVARWIALSNFSRTKLLQAGLPAERVEVLGQFVEEPAPITAAPRERLLFVGRLSPEKGLQTLAAALALCPGIEVDVIGSGPEADALRGAPGLRLHGALPPAAVMQAMQQARALVLPSIVFENFPRTLVEAFACGTPVIASRLGALAELVGDGHTGLSFEAGNANALAACLRRAVAEPQTMQRLGEAARSLYAERYSPQQHLLGLLQVYQRAIGQTQGRNK
jgi:glycosyltransferase involved in cell wall biosynthesis